MREIPVHRVGAGNQMMLLEFSRMPGLAPDRQVSGAGAKDSAHLPDLPRNQRRTGQFADQHRHVQPFYVQVREIVVVMRDDTHRWVAIRITGQQRRHDIAAEQ